MGRKNHKKEKKQKTQVKEFFTGTFELTRSRRGFVTIDGFEKDVMIPEHSVNSALTGDIVKIKLSENKTKKDKLRGEIVEVLQRKKIEFIGRAEITKNFAFVIPDSKSFMPDIFINPSKMMNVQNNDRVRVRITNWGKKGKNPEGEILTIIAQQDENNIAMEEIVTGNNFKLRFDEKVISEANKLETKIPQSEIDKRIDFRSKLTFTIDPVEAKDFDDAISFHRLSDDKVEIGVHIADVSHYVQPNTELDTVAYQSATSVYLPDRVVPMLPEKISNELCSLRPNEDKLTFSAIFIINKDAIVEDCKLAKTLIHSAHRFTYEEVQEIIDNKDGLYKDEIIYLDELAKKIRKERFDNGAINFSSQEIRFKLDENNVPIGIVVKESTSSHQLIEELMLLANRYVAGFLSKAKDKKSNQKILFPYRIHDNPDKEKLLPFISFAKKFGHKFDISTPDTIAKSFNKMLQSVQHKPEQHVLEQLGIRTMAKASYATENIGHYGLGFDDYCHFTSPIRRYPDMLVHRMLHQVLIDEPLYDKEMEKKCVHCSERERAAMDCERSANKYKQVEYMRNFIGDEFEGVISGVANFGFWVETVQHKCEGLITTSSLTDYDEFRLVETDYCLRGMRTGKTFRIGDKVFIKVIAANLYKRQLDYEWVLTAGMKK